MVSNSVHLRTCIVCGGEIPFLRDKHRYSERRACGYRCAGRLSKNAPRITEAECAAVRDGAAAGLSYSQIARNLGISSPRVRRIARGILGIRRTPAPENSPWRAIGDDTIVEMLEAGLTTAEIGRRLGLTKNAVIGRIDRRGLRPLPPRAPLMAEIVDAIPERGCRYIAGEPKLGPGLFCAKPCQPDSSYCPEHHARCHLKILPPSAATVAAKLRWPWPPRNRAYGAYARR